MGMIYKDTLTKLENTCAEVHKPIERSECLVLQGKMGKNIFN